MIYCLLHPTPGCFGAGAIRPVLLRVGAFDGTPDEVRKAVWPEYVVVAVFGTIWQARFELGARLGN